MKLAFNSLNSGLANNGGSRTVILCAEMLEELGHRCDIIAPLDNFTWFKHKKPVRSVPKDLDVLIATACTTVKCTSTLSGSFKRVWYIRGHESWVYNESQLASLYNSDLINIVNSKGLQQKLASCGAKSKVIYPGIDLDMWKNKKLRSNNKTRIGCLLDMWKNKKLRLNNKIRIGCLFGRETKRWVDFVKLAEILGNDGYEYVGVGVKNRKDKFLTDYWPHASTKQLNNIYNSCHIWFAPTELEGLHNPPMEAALCGCLIVCNDDPMNGMCMDYAFDNNTAMIYHRRDIEQAAELIRHPNWGVVDRMYNHLRNNMGTREENMKKLVDYLGKL